MPRLLFGKWMPKPEDEDGDGKKKKKKQPKKAAKLKKDEKPPPETKWAPEPGPLPLDTRKVVQMAEKDIMENVFPQNIRGEQCNSGVAPCIIKEVFFPPTATHEIATLIESALVY
jgi:hypothetical protein